MAQTFLKLDTGVTGTLPTSNYTSGITMADSFRLSSSFTGDATPITSNIERVDTDGFGQLGTGMNMSSGIFSFPSTGIYLIRFISTTVINGDNEWSNIGIDTTTDGSSFNSASDSFQGIKDAGNDTYANTTCEFIFDVTNTTTHKCRFKMSVQNNSTETIGNTGLTFNGFNFLKLGDT